ncbi:hypothetical protein [Kineosporia succinea]|uniref:Uncharacterized protein n=1 Tax=Kineosporia succinea TaxID=84632 RepID=A0ABT9P3E2_9ACTN|nr:hypothetical protein [Kineosporia succinea]MDP9826919.1 hypothetical protein [Kineosporia succinea]
MPELRPGKIISVAPPPAPVRRGRLRVVPGVAVFALLLGGVGLGVKSPDDANRANSRLQRTPDSLISSTRSTP